MLTHVREHGAADVGIESELIFNGVCVRLKGRINRSTLVGQARLEFNAERAETEEQRAAAARPHAQRLANLRNAILQ